MILDGDYSPLRTNREKSMAPKLGRYWCGCCDRYRVGVGQKCPICGAKPAVKKMRKEWV